MRKNFLMSYLYKGVVEALKDGYTIACWSSGGRVQIAVILDKGKTIFSGESGHITGSLNKLSKNYLKKATKDLHLMTGSTEQSDSEIFNDLNHRVVMGDYLQMNYNAHSNSIIICLDGYDENVNRVIRTATGTDVVSAVTNLFKSEMVPL